MFTRYKYTATAWAAAVALAEEELRTKTAAEFFSVSPEDVSPAQLEHVRVAAVAAAYGSKHNPPMEIRKCLN